MELVGVAILAGPGGPALPATGNQLSIYQTLRFSPVPEDRRCVWQANRPLLARDVAILAGPGGPALLDDWSSHISSFLLRFSPVPEDRRCREHEDNERLRQALRFSPVPEDRRCFNRAASS